MNGAITGRLIIVNPRTQAHRLLFARNFAHTFLLGQGIALEYYFSHQPHGGAITGQLTIVNPRAQAHRVLYARNCVHIYLLGQGIALEYNFSHQPHGGAITGRLLFLPTTAPTSVRLCMHIL